MKLLFAPASPFASKCRMAAARLKLDVEEVFADATNQAPELLDANPLGKIPCLLDEDEAIFDSRVITRYLNVKGKGSLYPRDERWSAPRMEALADGICDAAVAYQYELRFRPEEKVEQSWLDRQWAKVTRGIGAAKKDLPPSTGDIDAGSLSLAAALGYLDLRFAGKWQEGNGVVLDWQTRFDGHHPELAALKPSA